MLSFSFFLGKKQRKKKDRKEIYFTRNVYHNTGLQDVFGYAAFIQTFPVRRLLNEGISAFEICGLLGCYTQKTADFINIAAEA
jgi:hypothetical protein